MIRRLKTFAWIGQYLSPLRLAWGRFQNRQLVNEPVVLDQPKVRPRTSADSGIGSHLEFDFEA
jgi:hypothetical protein